MDHFPSYATIRPRLSGPLFPALFYPDPSPSGRKSLVTDLQHLSRMEL